MDKLCTFLLAACFLAAPAFGQDGADDSSETKMVDANPADVESLDAITAAVYASISGGPGVERQWDRFRSLFTPGAQLTPTQKRGDAIISTPLDIETYISRTNDWFVENGFFETEIFRKTEQYGSLVHFFSTYESRRTEADPEPFARGINSFQALHDGNRWWIVSIYWRGESEDLPIPAQYLPE